MLVIGNSLEGNSQIMRSHVANVADSKRPFRYSKIIVTIGVGMNMINLPIYLANCSPPRLRGTAINSYAAVVGECRVIRSLGVLLLTLSFSCNLQLSQLSSPLASFTHCQLTRVISSILFLLVPRVHVLSATGTLTKAIWDFAIQLAIQLSTPFLAIVTIVFLPEK